MAALPTHSMSSFVKGLAQEAQGARKKKVDGWIKQVSRKFENECRTASRNGHMKVEVQTPCVPEDSQDCHGLFNKELKQMLERYEFPHVDAWAMSVRGALAFKVVADWSRVVVASDSSDCSSHSPHARGGHRQTCGICEEDRSMVVLSPCGHVLCRACRCGLGRRPKCPFCRRQVDSATDGLFLG